WWKRSAGELELARLDRGSKPRMEEQHLLLVTKLVNWLAGKPVLWLLTALRLKVKNPEYPIPNHLAMELLVFALAVAFFLWLRRRLWGGRPGAPKLCPELLLTNPMDVGAGGLLEDIAGHDGKRCLPMIGSIGLFVLLSNLISL